MIDGSRLALNCPFSQQTSYILEYFVDIGRQLFRQLLVISQVNNPEFQQQFSRECGVPDT